MKLVWVRTKFCAGDQLSRNQSICVFLVILNGLDAEKRKSENQRQYKAQHLRTLFPYLREAGTLGMWIFLVTELMFFGGMFLAYTLYRTFFTAAGIMFLAFLIALYSIRLIGSKAVLN